MKFKKASAKIHDELIELYKSRTLNYLKEIQSKWAYEANADEILDFNQNTAANLYTKFKVRTRELIAVSEFNKVDCKSIFTGNLVNNLYISSKVTYPFQAKLAANLVAGVAYNVTSPFNKYRRYQILFSLSRSPPGLTQDRFPHKIEHLYALDYKRCVKYHKRRR